MKTSFILTIFLLVFFIQLKAQKIERRDAAEALNFIDNLPNPLKPAANNLVAYLQKIKANSKAVNDYIVPNNQIDSLKKYYNILIKSYAKAINEATQNKTIDKFQGLKSNFLKLLTAGQKPWVTVIPVYIKMFTKGKSKMSISEQDIISKASSILMNGATTALEYAKVVAIQEDEIEKKYHLELVGDLYK